MCTVMGVGLNALIEVISKGEDLGFQKVIVIHY